MQQAIHRTDRTGRRDSGFVVGVVVSAAIAAALFTLHVTPDVLVGKLPTLPSLGSQTR